MVLWIHQDYCWFFALTLWLAAGVFWLRSPGRAAPGWRWIPWAAGAGVAVAAIEISQLVVPAIPLLRVPSRLGWDVVLGAVAFVQAAGLAWSGADNSRQRAAAVGAVFLLAVALAAGSQQWGAPVVHGVNPGRVLQNLRVAAEPPPEWLLRAGLALSAAFHWAGGWCLAGATALGAGLHVRRAWPDRLPVLALALLVASVWFASAGPLADHLQFRRAFTELSPFGTIAAVLHIGCAAAVLGALLRRHGETAGSDFDGLRRELRRTLPWLAGWIAAGLAIAAAMGWIARRNFERGALGRVTVSAALLDRAAIARELGPEFRLDRIYTHVTHSGRVATGAISEHLGRGGLRPLNDALATMENANPDVAFAQMLTLRDGYLVACGRASHIPAPLRRIGVQRAATAADLLAWADPRPAVSAPFALDYGEFVRASAPLRAPDGRMLGWLTFDFTVSTWAASQAQARLQAFFIVGLGAGLLVALAFQRQLSRRHQQAAAAAAAAAAADRAKTAFLGKVSHELRTPIQSILGYGEMLAARPLGAEPGRWVGAIRDHGQLLIRLVNDLLDLSALQAGAFRLAPKPGRLDDLFRSVVESLEPRARAKGLELRLALHETAGTWHRFDPERVRQILLNLAGNAVKFTARGHVAVELAVAESAVTFAVADTGPGIPLADQPRLFQPFARLDATADQEGSGLGLALSAGLCRAMGGTLGVESDGRHGAVFRVRLPLPVCPPPDGPSPFTRVSLAGLRVLVADDNTLVRELFVTALRQHGAECDGAADGLQALALAEHTAFDVVVLDLAMPGADGYEVARRLRRSPAGPGKIIGVSAHARAPEREQALRAGMDRLLVKPVALSDLAAAVAGAESAPPFSLAPDLEPALRRIFAAEAGKLRRELLQAAEHADSTRLRAAAHYLKNSADIACLPALGRSCAALEQSLLQPAPDWTAARAAAALAVQELDRVAP